MASAINANERPYQISYHKQQRRDKRGTQPNKSTTHKMTKVRLNNMQQL